MSADLVINRNTPAPTNKQDILSNNKNKQQLINLISVVLSDAGITVTHAVEDGDADTFIIQEAVTQHQENDTVIVHSHDTDIFIGLLYHASGRGNVIMTTKKGPYSTTKLRKALDSDMIESLLFAHAVSGCDTVSATHGVWKVKAFKTLLKSKSLRKLVQVIGK